MTGYKHVTLVAYGLINVFTYDDHNWSLKENT